MRVWLVDDRAQTGSDLEATLRRLEQRPGSGLLVAGVSPYRSDFAAAMSRLVPDLLDLLVIDERVWPETAWTQDLLALGLAMVVIADVEQVERLRRLAELYPISFIPPDPPVDALWLALVAALASKRREGRRQEEVSRLQQRLEDRSIIEQAKALLIQGHGISEAEAYNRLRVQARQQRRKIREIAQLLLDTESAHARSTEAPQHAQGQNSSQAR